MPRAKTEKPTNNHFFITSIPLFERITHCPIARLSSELVILLFLLIDKPDLYLSLAAVVDLILRLVSKDVLRSQFLRYFFECPFELEHITGKKSFAAGLFAKFGEDLITSVFY